MTALEAVRRHGSWAAASTAGGGAAFALFSNKFLISAAAITAAALVGVALMHSDPDATAESASLAEPGPAPASMALPPDGAAMSSSRTDADASGVASPGATHSLQSANELVLRIVEATTGDPIPRVPIEIRQWIGSNFSGRRVTGSADGQCKIPLEAGITHLELTTRLEGYADTRLEWRPDRGIEIPASYTLRLQPGVRMGGRVVDADGFPVFGAQVGFNHEEGPPDPGAVETHQFMWIETETDVTGRWHMHRIAESMIPLLRGGASHPEHGESEYLWVTRSPEAAEALRAETHEFRLGRVATVHGRVVNASGEPVPGARVLVGQVAESSGRKGVTDSEGRFSIPGCRLRDTFVTGEADGYAATTLSVSVEIDMPPPRDRAPAGEDPSHPRHGRPWFSDRGGVRLARHLRIAAEPHEPARPGGIPPANGRRGTGGLGACPRPGALVPDQQAGLHEAQEFPGPSVR